jgi:hypothetical protein
MSDLPSSTPIPRVTLRVDLTGSNCGPEFRSVEVVCEPPADWADDLLLEMCADYYGVPVEQIALLGLDGEGTR